MNQSKNKTVGEIHGCLVCARLFNILAVYTLDGKLLDCAVTSPGGQIVPDAQQPLVACETHTTDKIESAYQRWLSRKSTESANEQKDE
jgi:hypothetical protein